MFPLFVASALGALLAALVLPLAGLLGWARRS
jgi:uncharacterized membrane protein